MLSPAGLRELLQLQRFEFIATKSTGAYAVGKGGG